MLGPVMFYWTLIALLVYAALLSMRLRRVRHVYFLIVKESDKPKIDITLNTLTPLIYWRRFHRQTIVLSALLGIFLIEATGEPGPFKYHWVSIYRLMIGVRRNPDGTRDGSIKIMKPTFDPGQIYLSYLAKQQSS